MEIHDLRNWFPQLRRNAKVIWENNGAAILFSYNIWSEEPHELGWQHTIGLATIHTIQFLLYIEEVFGAFFFTIDCDRNDICFHLSTSDNAPSKHVYHLYGSWLTNQMALVSYRKASDTHIYTPIIFMPDTKFSALRDELTNVLERFDIPQPAIRAFIQQCAKHLRMALKTHKHLSDARALWPRDRRPGENPEQFVIRVYGSKVQSRNMTQADLAIIDRKALIALRNYCNNRHARPKRPRISQILPPSRKNPDAVQAKFGKLTWANSTGAWLKNPTGENRAKMRAYKAFKARESRARHRKLQPG